MHPAGTWVPVLCPACIPPAQRARLLLTRGTALGRQVGATQKKGIRGSVCIIGTFYSSGHYTLTFPGAGQCIEFCFCGKYAPSKQRDCLAFWGATMGTGSNSSSTKSACSVWECLLGASLRLWRPASLPGCSEPQCPAWHAYAVVRVK